MATGAPDWLLEMNESEQSQWRAVEGGLYWPAVDQVIRLPRPMIDPEKLSEFMEGVREDGEGVLSMVIDEGGEED